MTIPTRERWYLPALLLAFAGSVGSVWLSVGLNLRACPLCFYQRSAVFLALATLLLGWVAPHRVPRGTAALLALPACFLGLGVALWHVGLELTGTLECPDGLAGLGTAPQQSLTAFVPLSAAALASARAAAGWRLVGIAVLLGVCGALAAIKSSPPLPNVPDGGYLNAPFDTCRKVHKPAA
jgi:disulfide bond formation protein DsbB